MVSIRVAGQVLAASRDDRIISGLLLPFGEQGRTSVGKITASSGAVEVPRDVADVRLDIEHDTLRPIGRAVSIVETDRGLEAAFKVARTRSGDDVLEEAAEGLRTGLSVEVDDPVIRAGQLVGGRLSGAGVVVTPAFPSAQLVASDMGEPEDEPAEDESAEDEPAEDELAEVAEDEIPAEEVSSGDLPDEETGESSSDNEGDEPEEEKEMVETVTASVPVGSVVAPRMQAALDVAGVSQLLAESFRSGGERKMVAALSDITGDQSAAQWVGELWSGKAYERRYLPLFNWEPLTSYEVKGWHWTTPPAVSAYAGDKAEVTSNAAAFAITTTTVKRLAGAHDIDRKYRDFGDASFFEAYFRAMAESYARQSDAGVLTDARNAALASSALKLGTVPSGVSKGVTAIVDGALSIIDVSTPSFAIVSSDLYRDLMLTRSDDVLAYLNAALGFEGGTAGQFRIVPGNLGPMQVLVGARDAATAYELGNGAPIRVEAEDISKGGIDEGVFGYYALAVENVAGLALVSGFAWATSTAVALGTVFVMSDGKVLEATTAGTTASTGTGPTAPAAVAGTVTDGTVTWTRRA